jgi:hypothetical protein
VSWPFDHATPTYTAHRIEITNFQGEPAAFNQTLPPGTIKALHSTSSSVFPFTPFVSPELSRQQTHEFHDHTSIDVTSVNSEAMYESGGSSPQSLTNGALLTRYTPASSVDFPDILLYVDDVTYTVEELNAHRNTLDLARLSEPHLGGFLNLDDDLAFHMDVVGLGEQFTGMLDISSQTL